MPIVLLIREDEDVHSVVLSEKPIVMGRSSSCDIKLSDEKISSRHLAIKLNPAGRVIIKDLESTNGTYLNGSQIHEAYLMLQDQLLIGGVSLWLDEAQLSLKEKRVLIRPDQPTQLKFINLQGTGSINPSQEAQKDNERAAKQAAEPVQKESKPEKVRDRVLKSSHQPKTAIAPGQEVNSEEQFDLDEASGVTKLIQVAKSQQVQEKKKKISKVKKAKAKAKEEGLMDKLFSIIKPKSSK